MREILISNEKGLVYSLTALMRTSSVRLNKFLELRSDTQNKLLS